MTDDRILARVDDTSPPELEATTLVRGHHLYRTSDDVWMCAGPGDRFTRIGGAPQVIERVQRALLGQTCPVADSRDPDAEHIDQLLDLLVERSVIELGRNVTASPSDVSIIVDGENPIADAVIDLLSDRAEIVRGSADEDSVAAADLVISCAGWLPDERWTAFQEWCVAHNTAWYRCHFEGDAGYLGPLWDASATIANYSDVRARRLAASRLPDELLSLWRYLDSADASPMRWPDRPGIAFIASTIAVDIVRYLDTGAAESVQLEVRPELATISRHPVLPLPDLSRNLGA